MDHLFWLIFIVGLNQVFMTEEPGCPLTEYTCVADKFQPGYNYETEYGITQTQCAEKCCSKNWCVGFEFTLQTSEDKGGRCHLLPILKATESLEASVDGTTHCEKKLGGWSSWSSCSASCGNLGTSSRTRVCHDGDDATCGNAGLREERKCNNMTCPGCHVDDFTCTSSENIAATSVATIEGVSKEQCALQCCGRVECKAFVYTAAKVCEIKDDKTLAGTSSNEACVRKVTFWTEWTACDKTCGLGTQNRTRECFDTCDNELIQIRSCNSGNCPGCSSSDYLCEENESHYWSGAYFASYKYLDNVECGAKCCANPSCVAYSYTLASTTCKLSKYTKKDSPLFQTTGTTHCQIAVGTWTAWSSCSAQCGTYGVRRRTRSCLLSSGCKSISLEELLTCDPVPCKGCAFSDYYCFNDIKRVANNFANMTDISLDACSQYCCLKDTCLGFSYNNYTKTCLLTDDEFFSNNLPSSTWPYVADENWMVCQQGDVYKTQYDCKTNRYQPGVEIAKDTSDKDACKDKCFADPECIGFNFKLTASTSYECVLSRNSRDEVAVQVVYVTGTDDVVEQCQRNDTFYSYLTCLNQDLSSVEKTAFTAETVLDECYKKAKGLGNDTFFVEGDSCLIFDPPASNHILVSSSSSKVTYPAPPMCAPSGDYSVYKVRGDALRGWGEWNTTSECSVSCGGGVRTQFRWCNSSMPGFRATKCLASDGVRRNYEYKVVSCNIEMCRDDGGWSNWVSGTCNVTCGGGYKTNSRICNNPSPGANGRFCIKEDGYRDHEEYKMVECNAEVCKVHGGWSTWTYDECSESCGDTGVRTRKRDCNNPTEAEGGLQCLKVDGHTRSASETDSSFPCNRHSCTESGEWSLWRTTEACTRTCGEGVETKVRYCDKANSNEAIVYCQNSRSEIATSETIKVFCNRQPCLVVGGWSEWALTTCTKTCGEGTQTRTRWCNNPYPRDGGEACLRGDGRRSSYESLSATCNVYPCTVNGGWTLWSSASCTRTCGGGVLRRTRSCSNPTPSYGGLYCIMNNGVRGSYEYSDTPCNTQTCSVRGTWGSWSLASCSKSCGRGTQVKTRSCLSTNGLRIAVRCQQTNGQLSQYETITAPCNTQSCPLTSSGGWSTWYKFGCSKTCGGGVETTFRYCKTNVQNCVKTTGQAATYEYLMQKCNPQPCYVSLSVWSPWYSQPCSTTCGSGVQARTRFCQQGGSCRTTAGGMAPYEMTQVTCNSRDCPACTTTDFACEWYKYQRVNYYLEVIYRVTENNCATRCCSNSACLGYNFYMTEQTCQLSRYSKSTMSLTWGSYVKHCQKR